MIQDDLIYKTLLDDMDCMIEIDNEKDVYHVAKADNFFCKAYSTSCAEV